MLISIRPGVHQRRYPIHDQGNDIKNQNIDKDSYDLLDVLAYSCALDIGSVHQNQDKHH
jgi:hypothetical protein